VPQVAARGTRQKNWGFEGRVELRRRAQTAAILEARRQAREEAAAREAELYYEELDALGYYDDYGYGEFEPFDSLGYFDDYGFY